MVPGQRLGYVCNPRSPKEGTETSRRRTDELGYRLERPIHFECKLNEPMHIGMRLLHPAAADHSVSINRQIRIQTPYREKRSSALQEFTLFPVDPKAQLAAIGTARRAGPVLICSSFKRKPQEWPVARKDRHMEVRVFQVKCCRPNLGRMRPKTRFCMSILKGGL